MRFFRTRTTEFMLNAFEDAKKQVLELINRRLNRITAPGFQKTME